MSYSEKFKNAVNIVLKHEGGYVNHPSDPGGETKYGITKRSYPDIDIRNLSIDQAIEIYHKDFWLKGPYEAIKHTKLAAKVFDTAVNMGTRRAGSLLQASLNALGAKLAVDGLVGMVTLSALDQFDGDLVLDQFKIQQANYYRALVARRPSSEVFLRGWLNRAAS